MSGDRVAQRREDPFRGSPGTATVAGRSTGRQYLNTSTGPPGLAVRKWPGGSWRTGGVIVAGAGTYWNDRYLRSASGSITETRPDR